MHRDEGILTLSEMQADAEVGAGWPVEGQYHGYGETNCNQPSPIEACGLLHNLLIRNTLAEN